MDKIRKDEYVEYCRDHAEDIQEARESMLNEMADAWDQLEDTVRSIEIIVDAFEDSLKHFENYTWTIMNPEEYSWFSEKEFPMTEEGDLEVEEFYDAYDEWVTSLNDIENDYDLIEKNYKELKSIYEHIHDWKA